MEGGLIARLQQLGVAPGVAARVNALAHPPVETPAGALLARAGEPATCLHLLADGWAHRWRRLSDERRQIVAFALKGEFCDVGALTSGRHGANLSAFSASRVRRLPIRPLRQLIDADASLCTAFQRLAHRQRLVMGELILSLGRRSAIERIAHLLCEIAVRLDGAPRSAEVAFALALTQSDLADIAGLSVVHVNRSLQALKRQLGVTVKARSVLIPCWAEMTALAEFDPSYLTDEGERAQAAPAYAPSLRASQSLTASS